MSDAKIKKTRTKKATIATCANCSLNLTLKEHIIEECMTTIQNIMNDTGKTIACGDLSQWEKFKLGLINYEHQNPK